MACELLSEFDGAFGRDKGAPTILVGWGPVKTLLGQEKTMGARPDPADFDQSKSTAILILSPFSGNTAARPVTKVKIRKKVVTITQKPNPINIGAAVLNQPYWIGVFSNTCGFNLPQDAK